MVAMCNDFHFWGWEPGPLSSENQGVQDLDVLDYSCADKLEEGWHDGSISFAGMPPGGGPLGPANAQW